MNAKKKNEVSGQEGMRVRRSVVQAVEAGTQGWEGAVQEGAVQHGRRGCAVLGAERLASVRKNTEQREEGRVGGVRPRGLGWGSDHLGLGRPGEDFSAARRDPVCLRLNQFSQARAQGLWGRGRACESGSWRGSRG